MIPFLGYGKEPMMVAPPVGIAGRYFLPDDGPHIIEADGFAEFDDFRPNRV